MTDAGSGNATVVVSGSGGGTNTVSYAQFSGINSINMPWNTGGTLSGDGTLTVTPGGGTGSYLWQVVNNTVGTITQSPVVLQWLQSSGDTAVHEQCLNAITIRIKGLSLSGVASNNIIGGNVLPRDWKDIDDNYLPGVLVTPPGQETQPGTLTGKDDIGYPCVITMVDKQNQDFQANRARNLLWRQQIFRALRNQPLPAVPGIQLVKIQPGPVIEPTAFKSNRFVSILTAVAISREARG